MKMVDYEERVEGGQYDRITLDLTREEVIMLCEKGFNTFMLEYVEAMENAEQQKT